MHIKAQDIHSSNVFFERAIEPVETKQLPNKLSSSSPDSSISNSLPRQRGVIRCAQKHKSTAAHKNHCANLAREEGAVFVAQKS